ncbi:hypothetical protein GF380_00850, partial [Candidatus Uhrbacteria bacterium]|nr:hypothetical protein [Candidatus Uhrbacteria bacterium]MBD3284662.1 hypothetical protein [Candidatus Uhrbacteria bacterium]
MKLKQGNILPLSLVIMTTILIAGISLGIIVLAGLRRASDLDDSMVAYYAADAGIEKQLYEVRKRDTDVGDLQTLGETFSNQAEWEAASSGFIVTQSKQFFNVDEGDFQFVDLFDPDFLGSAAGIARVDWEWTPATTACEVELGIAEWDISTGVPQTFQLVRKINGSGQQALDPARAYRLRFRPRKCDVDTLEVRVYSASDPTNPADFPGDITLGSEGTFDRATQAISVTMPRLDILSGVFSYVIFSECTLVKDPDGVVPTC